jgi:hypothetical protein
VVTFPHTNLHILVPTFTENLNLNFKILSEQKEFTLTNLPKYSLSLSPQDVTFSLLDRFAKTNHKIVSQTSLCQKPASARYMDALIAPLLVSYQLKSNISTAAACAPAAWVAAEVAAAAAVAVKEGGGAVGEWWGVGGGGEQRRRTSTRGEELQVVVAIPLHAAHHRRTSKP